MTKDWDEYDKRTMDEMDPSHKRKTWIHGFVKTILIGTFENMLVYSHHTMGNKWYEQPEDCGSPQLRRLWRIFRLWLETILEDEFQASKFKTFDEFLPSNKACNLMNQAMKIFCTVVDKDPAWHNRITKLMLIYDERRNDRSFEK